MIKTNGEITDLGPRNAVYWWLYCNGGRDNIRVFVKSESTVFVNRYGDTLTFNHVIDFKDAKFYQERFVDTNEKELCGELQNDADIMKDYCPNGESVSYEDLLNLYRKLMG